MQLPLLTPPSEWRPPLLSELPNWNSAKRIGIDIETFDPHLRELGPGVRRGAFIAGVSFALEDGPSYYLPLRHDGDNMSDPEAAVRWLKDQANTFEGEVVGANLSYDLDFLWAAGIKFPNIRGYLDVQIAEPLIDELQMSFSLEKICQKYLGIGKEEVLLNEAAIAYGIDAKKEMSLLPARYVGPYAVKDAELPLLIMRRQEKELESQDLFKIFRLESTLMPILVKMRQRGVRVDQSKLEQVEQWSIREEKKALAEVKQLTGVEIPFNSVWRAESLVPAIQAIGCNIPVTPRTRKPSIDKVFLSGIKHPVGDAISRARRVNKIRTTFVESVRHHMTNGRIHCTFHSLRSSDDGDEEGEGSGARYGRCSSQNPNMQQQPARDPEIGPLWRSIYIPEDGELWCSADFSSQEPRWVVHYANTTKLGRVRAKSGVSWIDAGQSAFDMAERYRNDPTTDPHQALADLIMGRRATKEERSHAKIIFLGLSYGMGGAKLCRSLGYPTMMGVYDTESRSTVSVESEQGKKMVAAGGKVFETAGAQGQALLDKFDASVPFVKALNKICQKAATTYGYIRTMEGRKCRFPRDTLGNIEFSHKALNRLIQGSAADQTKMAMLDLDKEGLPLILQIHDECCASVKNEQEAKRIAEIMENTLKLTVPSKVSCKIGPSWGEAKEL